MMRILAITGLVVLAGYFMNAGGLPQANSSNPGIGSFSSYTGAASRVVGAVAGK
ncbi:MAG: hypothetical protein AAFR73_05770 [Pseudomonadota bacterium]